MKKRDGYIEDIYCKIHNPQGHAIDYCPKCKKSTQLIKTERMEK